MASEVLKIDALAIATSDAPIENKQVFWYDSTITSILSYKKLKFYDNASGQWSSVAPTAEQILAELKTANPGENGLDANTLQGKTVNDIIKMSSVTTTLANGKILIGYTTNLGVERTVSGDATLSNTGVLALASTAVTPGAYTAANITVDAKGRITAAASGTAITPAALTRVDDTNVTVTLGGTPSTSLLQAVSLTLGWAGQLSSARGGLGINTSALSGYGKVTAGTWSIISASTLKSDLSLNLVENTALSTWAGTTNITTLGTISSGTWNGVSISTTYTDAKIKTVTGTTNRISIGGTATDPIFDISTLYIGQNTITTLGTIATGVWNGTAIGDTYISSAATWNAKLTSALTSAYFFVGNVSNVATGVAMSGDATLANTGAVTLASTTVAAGTYGDASNIPYFTVDAKGRLTSAGTNTFSAGNIYTQNGTSTDLARLIKTKTSDNTSYYSFQSLAGNNIAKFYGDNSIDFGTPGVQTYKNHYGNNTANGDSYFMYSTGTRFMGINYANGQLNFFNTSGFLNVNIQSFGGTNRGLIEIFGNDSVFSVQNATPGKVMIYAGGGACYVDWRNNANVTKAFISADGLLSVGGASTGVYNVEVYGSSLHKGAGSTSATYNTIWKNASNAQSLSIQDDGQIDFGTSTNFGTINFYQNSTLPDTIRFFRGASPYAYFNARDYNFSLAGPLGSAGLDGNGGVVNLSSSGAGVDIRTLAGAQKILLNIQGAGDAFLRMKSSAGGADRTNLYAGNNNFFLDPTGFGAATVGANILQVTGTSWLNGQLIFVPHTNASLTGANARVPSHSKITVILTNAGLTSIGSINNGGVTGGEIIVITNATGNSITIVNNYASAAAGEAILTGLGSDMVLLNNTTTSFQYNATNTVWASMNSGLVPVSGITPSTTTAIGVGSVELGNATDTTITRSTAGVIAVEGVVIPSISSTNTLTNKRVTSRVGTTTSSATPTINTDNVDYYSLTAQAADITSFTTNLSGTPTDAQKLWISITGTAARAITWGASFEASTITLPTTTVNTNRLDVGFIWNAATSKWRCVGTC